MTNQNNRNKWLPVMYATYYGILKDVAVEHGYTLAIHGSLVRDMDLILIPWVENAKPVREVLNAFQHELGVRDYNVVNEIDGSICHPFDNPTYKPHNRVSYALMTGGGGYLDISVFHPNSIKDTSDLT